VISQKISGQLGIIGVEKHYWKKEKPMFMTLFEALEKITGIIYFLF
jgi:hypothetical protein